MKNCEFMKFTIIHHFSDTPPVILISKQFCVIFLRFDGDWDLIFAKIEDELDRDPACGYRQMTMRLRLKHDLCVRRNDVMTVMRHTDPLGTISRKSRRLQRRTYESQGPDHVWHIDGHDKLKPYGLCIHGCIDGFSRKVLWLKVCSSNNNPVAIASFYVETIRHLKLQPAIIRSDRGTENVNVATIQEFLGAKHFYGTSQNNQRIEALWSILLYRGGLQRWREHFQEAVAHGQFNGSDIEIACVRYCYMDLLQRQLNDFVNYWNAHSIRGVGKPDILHSNEISCGNVINEDHLNDADVRQSYYLQETTTGSTDVDEYFEQVFNNMNIPLEEIESLQHAQAAYLRVRDVASQMEGE